MRRLAALTVVFCAFSALGAEVHAQDIEIEGPEVFLRDIPFVLTLSAPSSLEPVQVVVRLGDGTVVRDTTIAPLGSVVITPVVVSNASQTPLTVETAGGSITFDRPSYPGWVSLLPPLVAIVLAFAFREVVTSLFAGIWVGSLFLAGFNPISAAYMAANRFGRMALADIDHAAIVLFTLMLGGMVGIVTRMGGMRAIVDAVTPLATTRRRGQMATWLSGLAIFFDDYSNSLIVGNTMRPLTDRLKISREKLAYIVDSTAAPVAAIFFVSTWIGYEVSLIGGGLDLAAQQQSGNAALVAELQAASPFGIFLQTIPYLFYPILAILMVALVAYTGRDFGPMLRAERRAASGGGLFRKGAQLAADMSTELREADSVPPGRWWNGAIPVAVLVAVVLTGLVTTGLDALGPGDARTLRNIFSGADPYSPLIWGSVMACLAAAFLAIGQRLVRLSEVVGAWLAGLRAMLLAIVILVMAWSLGSVTQTLETAPFLAQSLSDTLAPQLLPTFVFIVAAFIAFSTGTSWATMAILLPLVVPLAITMVGTIAPASGAEQAIVMGSIGSVLAGAIMGDHCSPISDTTVLSSTASGSDHVDHVRTQLPYALLVGAVSILLGSVLTVLGVPAWVCMALGVAAIYGVLRVFGRLVDEGAVPEPQQT